MTDQVVREVQIVLSAGGNFYAVLDIPRTCGLWLSIAKHPLPVNPGWHRPGNTFAAVMRGRDYYRIGVYGPQHQDGSRSVPIDDELVKDWCDAAWWAPGLEEAWQALGEAERSRAKESGHQVNASEPSEGVCDARSGLMRTASAASDSKKKGGPRG
jgi:hypothetical protein